MARWLIVYKDMWDDPDFGEMEPIQQLFYLGCLTFADNKGWIRAHPQYLISKIFPYDSLTASDMEALISSTVARFPKMHLEELNGKRYLHIKNYGPNRPTVVHPLMRREWIKIAPKARPRIFERDQYTCRICGAKEPLEVDHIVPIGKGGTNNDDNLQTLCRPCNRRKWAY